MGDERDFFDGSIGVSSTTVIVQGRQAKGHDGL